MTKLKGIITVLAIAIFSTASFANTVSEKTQKQIRTEIAHLLKGIDLNKYAVDEATLQLHFLINQDSEIVVLSTNNNKFDDVMKARLNYQKINIEEKVPNQIYSVPITLKS